tara:strand:- start:154 stop:1731 length:1578 start_codon:yes stop_codon:yes gene_type:complete
MLNLFKKNSFYEINHLANAYLASLMIVTANLIVLFFYNLGEINAYEFIYSFFEISLIIGIILLLAFNFSKRIILFFPFGVLLNFQFLNIYNPLNFYYGVEASYIVFLIFFIWILSVIFLFNFNKKNLTNLNYILAIFIFFGALVQSSLINNASKSPPISRDTFFESSSSKNIQMTKLNNNNLPNIIYIIPDRYGGISQLRDHYNFSNSNFYDQLNDRGFVLGENSFSNYPSTYSSLASTLNGSYINSFNMNINKSASYKYIKNSTAFKTAKLLGYEIYNIDNWWKGSQNMKIADKNFYNNSLISQTTLSLLSITPTFKIFNSNLGLSSREFSCDFAMKTYSEVEKLANSKKQGLFLFVHLMAPHEPYLFDENGICFKDRGLSKQDILINDDLSMLDRETSSKNYISFLKFINYQLVRIFDAIQEKNDHFFFIIQSDEGPYPACIYQRKTCTPDENNLKSSIINGFYYSRDHDINKDMLKSPINNFNHIFNLIADVNQKEKPHLKFINKENIFIDSKKNFLFEEIE